MTPKSSRDAEAYWTFRSEHAGESLVLPDGRCDIILLFNEHKSMPATPVITGPSTLPYKVEYSAGDRWIGIRLRPLSGVALWKRRISCAADKVLRGEDAIAVLPSLAELKGNQLTLDELDSLVSLEKSNNQIKKLSMAIDSLHVSGGRMKITQVADFAGCSPRQLNRIFRLNVGLSTKTYAQLVQFHRTLKLIRNEHLTISGAAFEGGYTDHAHLTRSFQRFGGFTPSSIPNDLSQPLLFT